MGRPNLGSGSRFSFYEAGSLGRIIAGIPLRSVSTEADVDTTTFEDRLEVLFQMWDQLLDEGWQPALSDKVKSELDRRWADFRANPGSGLSEDQVMNHVRRSR